MQVYYIRRFTAALLCILIVFSGPAGISGGDMDTKVRVSTPATALEINDKEYKVTKADTDKKELKGIKSFSLSLTKTECTLKLDMGNKAAVYKIGVIDFKYNNGGALWDKGGWMRIQWLDDNNLEVIFRDYEEKSYFFSFTGNTAAVVSKNTEINGYSDQAYVPCRLIAHGGGGIIRDNKLLSCSNSLQALNESYEKGYRLMEVDIEWTTDNQLVLIHDWESNIKYYFNAKARRYSLKEFKAFKMVNGLTQLTVKDLESWVKQHADVRIITDIKSRNIDALDKISKENPYLKKQLIPQIYAFSQYEKVSRLGFTRSLLALWGMGITDEKQILDFARENKLFAVSISEERDKEYPNLAPDFKKLSVFAFIHTIDNTKIYNELIEAGAYGIFTNSIKNSDIP